MKKTYKDVEMSFLKSLKNQKLNNCPFLDHGSTAIILLDSNCQCSFC